MKSLAEKPYQPGTLRVPRSTRRIKPKYNRQAAGQNQRKNIVESYPARSAAATWTEYNSSILKKNRVQQL